MPLEASSKVINMLGLGINLKSIISFNNYYAPIIKRKTRMTTSTVIKAQRVNNLDIQTNINFVNRIQTAKLVIE